MKYKFDETLNDFLEGHLSYSEAGERLTGIPLDTDQAKMWNELKPLDEGLSERTAFRAELPWLVTKVTSRVNARQRAKEWVNQQGQDVLGGLGFQYSQMFSTLVWKALGAAVIGGFTGFLMGSQLAIFQKYQTLLLAGIPFPLVLAVSLGLISALIVVSPSLRKYYS